MQRRALERFLTCMQWKPHSCSWELLLNHGVRTIAMKCNGFPDFPSKGFGAGMMDTYRSIALTEPCSAIPTRRARSKSTDERCIEYVPGMLFMVGKVRRIEHLYPKFWIAWRYHSDRYRLSDRQTEGANPFASKDVEVTAEIATLFTFSCSQFVVEYFAGDAKNTMKCFGLRIEFHKPHRSSIYVLKLRKGT